MILIQSQHYQCNNSEDEKDIDEVSGLANRHQVHEALRPGRRALSGTSAVVQIQLAALDACVNV